MARYRAPIAHNQLWEVVVAETLVGAGSCRRSPAPPVSQPSPAVGTPKVTLGASGRTWTSLPFCHWVM
ncbi:MAG: hypothetical protein QOG28_701 [Trebonia sp.]|jgi:hypothetical protein|nr:hypothetical protein [Trebonia sp.]